ncbi:MAG: phage major capsid protein [bacterium]|nr:phage major capsid protein [bacterium]
MATTLSTFDAVLKEVYLGPIRDELNSKDTVYGILDKKDDEGGREMVIPVRKTRNQGFGFIGSTANVPVAGAQGYEDLKIPPKYYYGQLKVRQEVISQSRSSAGAFARAIRTEVEGLPIDMKDDLNRVILGNGDCDLAPSGIASHSTTTMTLSVAAEARRFGEQMLCDVWDDNATTSHTDPTGVSTDDSILYQGIRVTNVATNTGIITFNQDVTVGTATQYMVGRAGARTRDQRHEMMGLDGVIAETNPYLYTTAGVTNLQNIDRTANAWFNSTILGNGGTNRTVSTTLLQQSIDAANIKAGGKINCFVTTFGVRDAFEQQQLLQKRYPNTMRLPAGYAENDDAMDFIEYNGIPIVPDKFAPQNSILALDKRLVYIARLADFDWMDEDGSILHLAPTGEPAYIAIIFFFGELVTTKPGGCSKIDDVEGTDVV